MSVTPKKGEPQLCLRPSKQSFCCIGVILWQCHKLILRTRFLFALTRCIFAVCCNRYGHLDALKWLVEDQGADLSILSHDGTGVFHWAVYSGNLPTIEYAADELLRQDLAKREISEGMESGDGNLEGDKQQQRHPMFRTNIFGCDATHWAASQGAVPVLKWLHTKGFDLAHRNSQLHDALDKARYKGHAEAVAWLEDLRKAGEAAVEDGSAQATAAQLEATGISSQCGR